MKTRQDVIKTLEALRKDLAQNPNSWENPTLERYLEAMGAWLQDWGDKHNSAPSWDLMAGMLEAAKIYE